MPFNNNKRCSGSYKQLIGDFARLGSYAECPDCARLLKLRKDSYGVRRVIPLHYRANGWRPNEGKNAVRGPSD